MPFLSIYPMECNISTSDTCTPMFTSALLLIVKLWNGLGSNNWWLDKENVVHIYNDVVFSDKVKWNYVVRREMDGTWNHYIKEDEPISERQIPHAFAYKWNLDLKK
jgi:hypothetical protein